MRTPVRLLCSRIAFNLLYLSALTIALPWLFYRRCTTNRYREGIRDKLFGIRKSDLRKPEGNEATALPSRNEDRRNENRRDEDGCDAPRSMQTVWMHGVSVGEIQLLASLYESWHHQDPRLRFVISTTTDSGMALARKLFPDVSVTYFPFDFSWAVRSTLNVIRPDLIVLGELELWPNLTSISHQRHIPIAVVNGRLSEGSYRNYQRLSSLTRSMFSRLSFVGAQTDSYAQRFADCGTGLDRIEVTGSIKFDNVEFDRQHADVDQRRRSVGLTDANTTLVVGSTQNPEERAAIEAFLALRHQFPGLRLIVVPRHPDRFESVFNELKNLDVKLIRRSQLGVAIPVEDWEVLLVDTVGELRWWWGTADLAIVGGSFGTRGGQNMIEPAAFGANLAFGPNTSNFRDVVTLLLENEAAEVIPNLSQMQPWILDQLQRPKPGHVRAQNAIRTVKLQQGATHRTIDSLKKLLIKNQSDPGSKLRSNTDSSPGKAA